MAIVQVSFGQREQVGQEEKGLCRALCFCKERDGQAGWASSILLARDRLGLGEVGCFPEEAKDEVSVFCLN